MKKTILITCLIAHTFVLSCTENYAFIDWVRNRFGFSLFHQLGVMLGLLDQYEQGIYDGIDGNFGCNEQTCSCIKKYWKDFFQPIRVGNISGEVKHIQPFEHTLLSNCIFDLPIDHIHQLIKKYIVIQPDIVDKAASYYTSHLENAFIIGIYYKENNFSADRMPLISYKDIYSILLVHLLEKSNVKVFIVTDDERFYSFLKVKHPHNIYRYSKTEEIAGADERTLIECLLLAKSDLLLCTPSRITLTVSHFNPEIPVIEFGAMPILGTE